MNGASVSSTKTTVAPSLSTASPFCFEVLDDLGEHRVVEALAELDVEPDAQAVVDRLERPEAVGHELVPEGAVLGVAGVELGRLDPRGVLDGRVAGLDPVLDQPIEPGQLADGVGGEMRPRRGRSSSPRGSCRTASPSRPGGCRG